MNTQVPDGFKEDTRGRMVRIESITPLDLLRDQTVLTIVAKAKALREQLRDFKSETFSDLATLIATAAEQYDHKMRGEKGNVTFISYDGRYKVVRAYQDLMRFDEQFQVAKSMIEECLTTWTESSPDELRTIINHHFAVNAEGNVSVSKVLALRRYNFKHPLWIRAMEAISNSILVIGAKGYIRLYERIDGTESYKAISLDLATL